MGGMNLAKEMPEMSAASTMVDSSALVVGCSESQSWLNDREGLANIGEEARMMRVRARDI